MSDATPADVLSVTPRADQCAATRKVTQVVVAVLYRPDGSFLMAQRPEGKPYAGWWEFPGGKIEMGEAPEAALVRELHEELGVTLTEFTAWHVIEHDYPHAYVRLQFFKVSAWQGEPQGREGQAFSWQQLPVSVEPVLPATHPVFDWMQAEGWIVK